MKSIATYGIAFSTLLLGCSLEALEIEPGDVWEVLDPMPGTQESQQPEEGCTLQRTAGDRLIWEGCGRTDLPMAIEDLRGGGRHRMELYDVFVPTAEGSEPNTGWWSVRTVQFDPDRAEIWWFSDDVEVDPGTNEANAVTQIRRGEGSGNASLKSEAPACAKPDGWESTTVWPDPTMTFCKTATWWEGEIPASQGTGACQFMLGTDWHLCTELEFLARNDGITSTSIFHSYIDAGDTCHVQHGWDEGVPDTAITTTGWMFDEHQIGSDNVREGNIGSCLIWTDVVSSGYGEPFSRDADAHQGDAGVLCCL